MAWHEDEAFHWIRENIEAKEVLPRYRLLKENLFHGAPIFAPLDPIELRICTNEDDLRDRFFEDIISLVPDQTELYIIADAMRDVAHPQLRDDKLRLAKKTIREYKVNLIAPPREYHSQQDFYYDKEYAQRLAREAAMYHKPLWKL